MADYGVTLQQNLVRSCTAVEAQPSAAVPADAMAMFHEGLEHFQTGDPGAAVSALSQSVLRAPEFGEREGITERDGQQSGAQSGGGRAGEVGSSARSGRIQCDLLRPTGPVVWRYGCFGHLRKHSVFDDQA